MLVYCKYVTSLVLVSIVDAQCVISLALFVVTLSEMDASVQKNERTVLWVRVIRRVGAGSRTRGWMIMNAVVFEVVCCCCCCCCGECEMC